MTNENGAPGIFGRIRPPGTPGPAPHIKLHEKSAPQINSKAKWFGRSLAGFFVRRHLALELVRGVDFPCKLMCGAGPGDLGGPEGLGI